MKKDSPVICAISTAPFKSAIAIIRVSGNDVFEILSKIISFKKIFN